MAGDWIKMQKSLPRDPRVVRISSALKADRLRTVGGLLSAWCLFDEQTSDGQLDGYTPELLDEIIGFPGLARAMESVGWLEVHGESLVIPRFDEHNGRSAKRRAQDGVRKMSARKADNCPQKKRTKSGLEKRREEKIDSNLQSGEPRGHEVPTLAQVTTYAATAPVPISEACAVAFHDTQEAAGWITRHGHSIADWRAALRRYASYWNENDKARRGGGLATKPQRNADIDGELLELP